MVAYNMFTVAKYEGLVADLRDDRYTDSVL